VVPRIPLTYHLEQRPTQLFSAIAASGLMRELRLFSARSTTPFCLRGGRRAETTGGFRAADTPVFMGAFRKTGSSNADDC
jgi:hypothetical protein